MFKKLNILIVEDAPMTRVFLKRLILSYGHNIVGMPSNGKDALEMIRDNEIDLIFMDINIDGSMDGISVIQMMKTKHSPSVYFISAYSDMETVNDALNTHASSYIIKPIKESDIHIACTVTQNKLKTAEEIETIALSRSLTYNLKTRELYDDNHHVALTKIEKLLIDLFVLKRESTVSYENILNYIWEGKEISASTMRSSIAYLRKKLPSLQLETNIGRGYILKIYK